MRDIANQHAVSASQIALAWLLARPGVTSVIIGMKRLAQLTDNPGATDIVLTVEERAQRDAISAMPPHYPGWMIDQQGAERCPRPFAFTVEK